MFRYVKGEGKEKWKLIENSEKALHAAINNGAHFVTVLSLDQDVDKSDPDAKINYKGPMYFDIDSSDENDSLSDCRKLLLALYKQYGVNLNDCAIYCSGGKGFHVLVPAKVFSTGKCQPYLPQMYKTMALEFNLEHVDLGIYSGGKGRCFRIENVKRDTGRYKIKLTAAQVFGMTWDQIKPLTFIPGENTPFDLNKDVEYAAELAALFRRSDFKPQKIIPVENAKLQALPGDPGCIKKIIACQEIQEGRRFNQVTMILAMYANGRGWTVSDLEQEAAAFIENYPSSVYKTLKERKTHIKAIYGYVANTPAYSFNCAAVRKTVNCEMDCCPVCPIGVAETAEYYDPRLGIEIASNCYFKKSDSGRTQLSTFVIKPSSIIEFIDHRETKEYTIYATIIADNDHKQQIVFTQPDWASKSALIKKLPHPAFAYIGGDSDVQKIFKVISQIEVPKKVGVKVIGMHKVNSDWHFVTDKGSINKDNSRDEILLETDYYLPTNIINEAVPNTEEMRAIISLLFKFNSIDIAVPLVGWFIASMYKERIFEFTRQFPLLFIFGAAGAGKTQTILNLKRLFSLEMDNIKSIADVTPFTLIKSASSNNTIPLMLDEYKATTFNQYQIKMVSKLIRAAYNNEVGERGTASQEIKTYYYRSPIILAGEQTVTEPAARDRIVEVHMSKDASAPHLEAFNMLKSLPLGKLGKALLMNALTISDTELRELYDKCFLEISDMYIDRPRLNQAVLSTGMQLLAKIVKPYGLDKMVHKAWAEYSESEAKATKEDVMESRKSDVDRILEGISMMSETDDRYQVAPNWEFTIEGHIMLINMRVVYTKYQKFAQEYKTDVEPMNYTSFTKLIKKEPYFVKDSVPVKLKQGLKLCMALDVDHMERKKLHLQGLLGAKEVVEQEADLAI
jgi:hypothetical protein